MVEVEASPWDEEMKQPRGPEGTGIMYHMMVRSSGCFPFGLAFRKAWFVFILLSYFPIFSCLCLLFGRVVVIFLPFSCFFHAVCFLISFLVVSVGYKAFYILLMVTLNKQYFILYVTYYPCWVYLLTLCCLRGREMLIFTSTLHSSVSPAPDPLSPLWAWVDNWVLC